MRARDRKLFVKPLKTMKKTPLKVKDIMWRI